VFFGTGKYLTQNDVANTAVNSWYGLEVQSSPGAGDMTTSSRSQLVQRQIIAEQAGSTTPFQLPVRAVTLKPATDDMTGKNGWYMDLVSPIPNGVNNPTAQGERIVVPNQFQGNLLLATTRIPQPSATVDPCNPAGGGWIMAIDPFTGTNPANNFFDTNGDGNINSTDTILVNGVPVPVAGVGFTSLPNAPIFVGVDMLVSFDNGTTSTVKTTASAGGYARVSWQEVVLP
jgi:type IV pilus assembly protein PilY1